MIASAMGADFDFENVAILGARDFRKRRAAVGTAFLVVGQNADFVDGGQMIVVATAMPLAAWLLAAFPGLAVVAWIVGIDRRLGVGGRLGFTTIEAPLQFANLSLEELNLLGQVSFPQDGTLVLGTPIVGLLPKFDELKPQAPQSAEGEVEEQRELAKALPQPGNEIGLGIVDNGYLLGRKSNQRIGGIGVHALPMVGSGVGSR